MELMRDDSEGIQTVGPPVMTDDGLELFSFHLRRFLASVSQPPSRPLYVTVGLEGSECRSATFEVGVDDCQPVAVEWTFEDLCHAYRYSDGRLCIEGRDEYEQTVYEVVPLLDRPVTGGAPRVVLGYVVYRQGSENGDDVDGCTEQIAEALRCARRNAIRMFFDEEATGSIKQRLYELMGHFPEWFGCDHSASLLMTSTLETMALDDSEHGRLDIVAERLFLEDTSATNRLVGMSVLPGDESSGVLGAVVRRQRADPDLPYQVYERVAGDGWCAVDEQGDCHADFHRLDDRRDAQMYVFLPLTRSREEGAVELLGFLCLGFRNRVALSSSVGETLASLRRRLSAELKYSPLFTLGARKLRVLQRTRQLTAEALADRAEAENDDPSGVIERITTLVAHRVDVPSFGIGYVDRTEAGGWYLRYPHPHGWTHYDDLDLPIDVDPEERRNSGVSALAVRIDRPCILAGGHGSGAELNFKNHLYVDESQDAIVDARHPEADQLDTSEGDWRPLRDYYKPARHRAYATLAYPISFAGDVLGVLTVEVDEDTSWAWWTGFGGQLFWETLADELASAFHALGVQSYRT
ncbi:MAG: hypothetical protein ABEL76_05630 [Bradymonadaceae bacterium]